MTDRTARASAYNAESEALRPAPPFPYSQLDAYIKVSPRKKASVTPGSGGPTATEGQATGSPPPAQPAAEDALPGLKVSYNAPPFLPLDLATDFRLFIGPEKIADGANFRGAPGAVESHPLAPVKIVRAVLSGPRQIGWVDIDDSKTTPCQTMDPNNKAEWDWFVTPRTTHHMVLTIKLYSVASCDEAAPTPRLVDNFDIPVTATLWELMVHFAKTWQGVLGAIVALIAAVGAAVLTWQKVFAKKG